MRKLILIVALGLIGYGVDAQTTITAADMPVAGDTLRYSVADITSLTVNLYDSGANKAWNYVGLTAVAQQVDTYKTAVQVNPTYFLTAPAGCYGYKVADSVPGLSSIPGIGSAVSIKDLYTFFNLLSNPSAFAAVANGATVSGFAAASPYTVKDKYYFFPLSYGRVDSSTFAFATAIPTLGSLNAGGSRVTKAEGWGTITTPFYTTPVNCLRVRSVVHQIDTLVVTALNLNLPVPSNTVDYKWLVNGQHYPALWITTNLTGGTETVTSITYRDSARAGVSVPVVKAAEQTLSAFPNPASSGRTQVDVPASWGNYAITVYDITGREVSSVANKNVLDLSALPAGHYIARVVALNHKGYVVVSR